MIKDKRKAKQKWRKKAEKISKSVNLIYHIIVISFSLCVGIIIFLFVNFFILPQSLTLPKTTAINWFTLHKHSMTLDYIRFILFVLILESSMMIGWFYFVWREKK